MLAFVEAVDSRGNSNIVRLTYLAHVRSILVGAWKTMIFHMCPVPTLVGPESTIGSSREVIE